MGYNAGAKVYKLVFEDREGLTVKVLSLPLGGLIEAAGLADQVDTDDLESLDVLPKLFEIFVKYCVGWNIELPKDPIDPESELIPVPRTVEGLMSLDLALSLEIIFEWLKAIVGVSIPLGAPSTGGGTVREELIPMETLPLSPES